MAFETHSISNTLQLEITPSIGKLTRRRPKTFSKVVYLPMQILNNSVNYFLEATLHSTPEEKTLFATDEWIVCASEYRGNVYVNYIKLDEKGHRN